MTAAETEASYRVTSQATSPSLSPAHWAMYATEGQGMPWIPYRWARLLNRELVNLASARAEYQATGHTDRTRFLMVSVPVRHGKSLLGSIFFSSWWLGVFPDDRLILTGKNNDLATDFARQSRDYLKAFGEEAFGVRVSKASAAANRWDLAHPHRGGLLAVGVGQAPTGRGAHCLIMDDPVAGPDQAYSEVEREKLFRWYQFSIRNRLEPGGVGLLIMSRWHCLLPGQHIMTPVGYIPVEQITEGDRVLTSRGFGPVLASGSRSHHGPVVTIRTYGWPTPLTVTPEHRVLTRRGWLEARELAVTDEVCVPVIRPPVIDPTTLLDPEPPSTPMEARKLKRAPLTKDDFANHRRQGLTYQQIAQKYGRRSATAAYEWASVLGVERTRRGVRCPPNALGDLEVWWALGLWLAEGTITFGRRDSPHIIRWTLGYHETDKVDRLRETFSRWGLTIRDHPVRNGVGGFASDRESSSISVTLSCRNLAEFIRASFRTGSHTKIVPEWAWALPLGCRDGLREGWAAGDGCLDKGWRRVATSSLHLAEGMRLLALADGIPAAVMCTTRPDHWEVRWSVQERLRSHTHIDSEVAWVGIKRLTQETYEGPVHDLKTEAHDFVAEGMIVHNSDDIAGRLLARQDQAVAAGDMPPDRWKLLRLPALAEPSEAEPDPLGRERGQALCPERYDEGDLISLRDSPNGVGAIAFAALFQNNPQPAEGGLFRRQDWRYCNADEVPAERTLIRAWDLAATEKSAKKSDPDWTAGCLMARASDGRIYVLDVRRTREEAADVQRFVRGTAIEDFEYWNNRRVFVPQDPGQAGKAQVGDYAKYVLPEFDMDSEPVTGDKVVRATPFASQQRSNNVVLVRGAWNDDFVAECGAFPRGTHDDMVDAAATAYGRLLGLTKTLVRLW